MHKLMRPVLREDCTNRKKGFTLLEILLVIAIIAMLAAIVIIAINPAKQLADSRNAQRETDINTILNATYQYAVDNNGSIPATITSTPTAICATGGTCTGLVDLNLLTTNEKYLVRIPSDPTGSTADSAGYNISRSVNNRIVVSAPSAEQGKTISVTR